MSVLSLAAKGLKYAGKALKGSKKAGVFNQFKMAKGALDLAKNSSGSMKTAGNISALRHAGAAIGQAAMRGEQIYYGAGAAGDLARGDWDAAKDDLVKLGTATVGTHGGKYAAGATAAQYLYGQYKEGARKRKEESAIKDAQKGASSAADTGGLSKEDLDAAAASRTSPGGGVNPTSGARQTIEPVQPKKNGGDSGNRTTVSSAGARPVNPGAASVAGPYGGASRPARGRTASGNIVDMSDSVSKGHIQSQERDAYSDYVVQRNDRYHADQAARRRNFLNKAAQTVDKFHADRAKDRLDSREFSRASDWDALGGVANAARDYESLDRTVKDADGLTAYDRGKKEFDDQRKAKIQALSDRANALGKRFRNGENSAEGQRFQRLMQHVGNPYEYVSTSKGADGKEVTSTITPKQYREMKKKGQDVSGFTRKIRDDFQMTDAQMEALEKSIGGMEKSTDKWKQDFDRKMAPYQRAYVDNLKKSLGGAAAYIDNKDVLESMADKRFDREAVPLLQAIANGDASRDEHNSAYGKLMALSTVGNGRRSFSPDQILRDHLGSGDETAISDYEKSWNEYYDGVVNKLGDMRGASNGKIGGSDSEYSSVANDFIKQDHKARFDRMYAARLALKHLGVSDGRGAKNADAGAGSGSADGSDGSSQGGASLDLNANLPPPPVDNVNRNAVPSSVQAVLPRQRMAAAAGAQADDGPRLTGDPLTTGSNPTPQEHEPTPPLSDYTVQQNSPRPVSVDGLANARMTPGRRGRGTAGTSVNPRMTLGMKGRGELEAGLLDLSGKTTGDHSVKPGTVDPSAGSGMTLGMKGRGELEAGRLDLSGSPADAHTTGSRPVPQKHEPTPPLSDYTVQQNSPRPVQAVTPRQMSAGMNGRGVFEAEKPTNQASKAGNASARLERTKWRKSKRRS